MSTRARLTFEDILRNEAMEKARRELDEEERRAIRDEVLREFDEEARRAIRDEVLGELDEEERRAIRDLGKRQLLLELLTERFGPLPAAVTQLVARGTRDDLACWGKRILAATSLDDVFATS
jgi:hypothetical protein